MPAMPAIPGKPLVSILIFSDNSDKIQSETIRQFTGQEDMEVFLINSDPTFAAAANKGLMAASGEYIMFVDRNDRVSVENLRTAYHFAIRDLLDFVWVSPIYGTPPIKLSKYIPSTLFSRVLRGGECLAEMIKEKVYTPSPYGHLFRKDWLSANSLRFEEELPYPEELWMQEAFCWATRMMVADLDIYFYSNRESKVHNIIDTDKPQHVIDLFRTADRLLCQAERYSFDREDGVLKSWSYANALRIYFSACRIVTAIRTHGVLVLPIHKMHTFKSILPELMPEAAEYCRKYYKSAAALEQEHLIWCDNPCDPIIAAMPEEELRRKRIILVYNNPGWQEYNEILKTMPGDYVLTLDRKYLDRAFAVVFHMPGLNEHLSGDLCKPDGQIWVQWNMEPETKFRWMDNLALDDLFDLRMDYHPEADVVCPYYAGFKPERVATPVDPFGKKNRVCMLISSGVNQSRREEYLAELMKYTRIDSYGRLFHNTDMGGEDQGWDSKVALYSQYKFVIAFENSVLEDYVTEKLYDPLLAGTVPIYLGAPNVEEYLPGDDCVVRADRFDSPKELAQYLERCYTDDEEYLKHYRWRGLSWREDFVRKVEVQDDSPFVRLCRLLDEKHPRT